MNPELQKLLTPNFLCPWCQSPMQPVTNEDNRMCKPCSLFLYNSGNFHSTLCAYLLNKYFIYFRYDLNQIHIASDINDFSLTIHARPPFPTDKEELTRKLHLYLTFS